MHYQTARKPTPYEAFEQIETYQKYYYDIVESTTRFRNGLTQLAQKYSLQQFSGCIVQPLLVTSLLEYNATRLIYDFYRLQISYDRIAKLSSALKASYGWSKDSQLLGQTSFEFEMAMIEIYQNIFNALQKFSQDQYVFINQQTDYLAQQLCDMYGAAAREQMLLSVEDGYTLGQSQFNGFQFTDQVYEQFVGGAPDILEAGTSDAGINIDLGAVDFNASE